MNSLTRQLTATKTGNVVEKFFESQGERRRIRDQVNQANQKVLLNHEIRMTPVRDYVLSKFDSWINEIQKRGVKVEVTSKECPSVVVGVRKGIDARVATFQSGDRVVANFITAVVQDGRLTEELLLRITFNSANGSGADGMVFNAQVGENNYTLNKTKARFAYKEYTGKSDNPIRDPDFITSLDQALDEGMAFVVEEATATK